MENNSLNLLTFIGCCQPGAALCFQLFLKATWTAFNPLTAHRVGVGGRLGVEGWARAGGWEGVTED